MTSTMGVLKLCGRFGSVRQQQFTPLMVQLHTSSTPKDVKNNKKETSLELIPVRNASTKKGTEGLLQEKCV